MSTKTLEPIEPYLIGVPNELKLERERQLCRGCGSEDIYKESTSSWDIETQQWETNTPFYDDKVICNQCGMNASPDTLSLDMMHIQITDAQWTDAFKPITNHLNPHANWYGCLFDYKGEEYEVIKNMLTSKPNHIWTVTDDDCSHPIAVSGWHFVNRHGYIITTHPFRCDVSVIDNDDYT